MAQLPILKPRVSREIVKLDRVTKTVSANVNFEDIDLRINGEGSEVYDYEYIFVLHSSSSGSASIEGTLQNLTSYSYYRMRGAASSVGAAHTTRNSFLVGRVNTSDYPAISEFTITGYVGTKRHINGLSSYNISNRIIEKTSFYTADTSTEINSTQFFSSADSTITYSLLIIATPKIQYNPNAILIKNLDLVNQSADIVVSGLDGEVYDYVACSSGLSNSILLHIEGDTSTSRIEQQLYNNDGSISSSHVSATRDSALMGSSSVTIASKTGTKKLTSTTNNRLISWYQIERATWNPDTSTPMTSLMLKPSKSLSGNVQIYAVPRGYNASLIPWKNETIVDIAGDFSAGVSVDIPDWANYMNVDFVGEGRHNSLIDFNNASILNDRQYLQSASSNTTAGFNSNISNLANLDGTGINTYSALISLKDGSNRPFFTKSAFDGNRIFLQGSWLKNSSTVFTSTQIKADNTNTINGKLTISFY